jgi:hypothetical protein
VSFVKSPLHASTSGAANVAPLPFIEPAKAGEADTNKNDVAIATTVSLLRDFIYSSISKNYV